MQHAICPFLDHDVVTFPICIRPFFVSMELRNCLFAKNVDKSCEWMLLIGTGYCCLVLRLKVHSRVPVPHIHCHPVAPFTLHSFSLASSRSSSEFALDGGASHSEISTLGPFHVRCQIRRR
jgi:hypothetical protein